MRRIILSILLGLICFLTAPVRAEVEVASFPLPEDLAPEQHIRVAILEGRSEVRVFAAKPYRIEVARSRALLDRGSRLFETRVVPSHRGIRLGRRNLGVEGIRLESSGGAIGVDGRNFRDRVEILKGKAGKLLIVNEVELEAYLKGVLPREMLSTWPREALKAQAVASRTFALFKALSKSGEVYAVAGDVIGQVYGGHGSEVPATDRLVDATRGQILTYKGEVFPAYFHSTCAGRTNRPEYNWDIESHPVLGGVSCYFCSGSKHYRWATSLAMEDIEARLRIGGYDVGSLREVVPGLWDESGRARQIMIRHSRGRLLIRANDFRLMVGPQRIKSLKHLRVSSRGRMVRFSGYGWGHGVGMCQWGAKTLAEQGKNYREILEYYYPGARIVGMRSR